MRSHEFVTEAAIGLSPTSQKARAWIQMVYDRYPQTWQNNHVMPIGPEEFAMFELTPSLSRRDAVEVKWFQAYPLRQGVGSKAMKILQALAREHDISLTLFPWDKGQVSQAKLTKFYRGQGFSPTVRGGKAMQWSPDQPGVAEGLDEVAENKISFRVQKGKNKFATALTLNGKNAGVYQYDATTGRSIAEVYPEFKGKGLGKLLVLHAIYTAAQLGLDFQEDESRTAEYDNVLDSLSSNGYIVDDDGYWYVTGTGEQYLNQSLKQGVSESAGIQPPAAGCIVVAADTGRWCLQQRSNTVSDPGVWSTWGGGAEPGETLQQTVLRELAEESGYTGPVTLRLVDSRPGYATFMARVPHEFEPRINSESQDWRWCAPDQLPRPLHPGLTQALSENFADGKKKGRKGLSKRVGIPKKASLSQLQKIASSSTGERRRMAQWQLNMRRGKAKKNK